jgi:hypothetical protein
MLFNLLLLLIIQQAQAGEIEFPYGDLLKEDSFLGLVNRENIDFSFDLGNGNVRYKTDSIGARDNPPKKDKKVLVVGASWTFGLGVPHNQLWSEKLEKSFCEYSFYNISVPGYLIDQIYLALEKHLATTSNYDLIIFEISPYKDNDRILSPYTWSPNYRKPFFRKDSHGQYTLYEATQTIPYLIDIKDISNNFLKYLLAGYNRIIRNYFLFPKSPKNLQDTAHYIFNQAVQLAKSKDIPLLFVSHSNEILPLPDNPIAPIRFINFDDASKGNKISPDFGHINHRGHAIIAEGIQKYLLAKESFKLCEE